MPQPVASTVVPTERIPAKLYESGWCVAELLGANLIPGYDPEEVGRGLSKQLFLAEIMGSWSASAGKLVYPEFDSDRHVSLEPLPYYPQLPLVCGWDLPAATGGTPAFVPTQVAPSGQWYLYPPVVADEADTISPYEFGGWVAEHLTREYAHPAGLRLQDLRLLHYGDPAGNQKPIQTAASAKTEVRSAFEQLRLGEKVYIGHDDENRAEYVEKPGFGWVIRSGPVSLRKRLDAVRARLTTTLMSGAPAMVIDRDADYLREAFGGGYNYKQRADGIYELDPCKNKYSHGCDAAGYCASMLFTATPQREHAHQPRERRQTGMGGRARQGSER